MLALAGCAGSIELPPAEIPAGLQTVINGRTAAQVAENDAMFARPPGTQVDDLAGLDGCWAAYRQLQIPADAAPPGVIGDLAADYYELWRLDAASGTASHEMLMQYPTAGITMVVTGTGTYTISGGNRITLIVPLAGMAETDLSTGALITVAELVTAGEPPDGLPENGIFELTYLATLEGDRLLLFPTSIDEQTSEEVINYDGAQVLVRFTCPD